MMPIIGEPPFLSNNRPDTPTVPCRGCGMGLALNDDSMSILELNPGVTEPWCLICAASRWPDMLVAGSEHYLWTIIEDVDGVTVGHIKTGPIRIADYVNGARKVMRLTP